MTATNRRPFGVASCAAILGALVQFGTVPATAETVDLTREQGLLLAREALLSGNPRFAKTIAVALLQGKREDPYALLLLSGAETRLGNPAAGRAAGRAAWSASRGAPDGLRYDIARYAALAAMHEGRVVPMQFWMRRALDVAPTEDLRRATIRDYREVREQTKLKLAFSFAATPTDNLNSGTSDDLLTVDGSYILGTLSGSSQALSGVRTDLTAGFDYRLSTTARATTDLGMQFSLVRNFMSDAAKVQAPDISNADLNTAKAEANLSRSFRWGAAARPIRTEVALGAAKEGRADPTPFARLEVAGQVAGGQTWTIGLRGVAERHWLQTSTATTTAIAADGSVLVPSRIIGSGLLSWNVSYSQLKGDGVNQDRQRAGLNVGYTLGKPIGPATLSAGFMAGVVDYPSYMLGPIAVTKGRTDTQSGIFVNMTFKDLGVLGYAPSLSVGRTKSHSNISRFSGSETSVTFGLKSQF